MLRDIRNSRWLYIKAAMLLSVGIMASTLILIESPQWRTVGLLSLAIWGFCRAYYFAFYVIQHYVDPSYRFAGLIDFARCAMFRGAGRRRNDWPDSN